MAQQSNQQNRGRDVVNPTTLQSALKGAGYPASKDDLVQIARRNGADSQVLRTIQGLPDQNFTGPDDVMKAFGNLM